MQATVIRISGPLRFMALLLLADWGGAVLAEEAREIGFETQLFVDDWIVEDLQGVVRRLNPLRKHPQNPILKPDRPWEGQYTFPNFVVYDQSDQLFKMWYVYIDYESKRGEPHPKPRTRGLAYAVSRDGVSWEKPELGLVTVPGFGKKTNAVAHQPSIYDTHESEPQKRYKAVIDIGDRSRDMGVAWSPDGLHWSLYGGNPVISKKVGAGGVLWDDRINKYLGYFRPLPAPPVAAMNNVGLRVIGRSVSPDFISWTLPEDQVVMAPDALDPPDTQFYKAAVFKDRGVYFSFVSVYHINALMVDVQLLFSRDGIEWQRVGNRHPILTYGMPDRFDSHQVYVSGPPLILDDEIRVYYLGQDEAHLLTPGDVALLAHRPERMAADMEQQLVNYKGAFWWYQAMEQPWASHGGAGGLATARRDGFVSLDAGAEQGQVTTRAFWCRGKGLAVNVDALDPRRFKRLGHRWREHPGGEGEIRAELLDEAGTPLEGYQLSRSDPFKGDSQSKLMSWGGESDLSPLRKKRIRIRFSMKNAKLYSFRLVE